MSRFDKTVFIINDSNVIESVIYRELIKNFAEQTTTPNGVDDKIHIREKEDDEGNTVYELWTWGYMAQYPKRLRTWETEEDAEIDLLECHERDFIENGEAPVAYETTEDAEEALLQMKEDEI